ncbi:MAG: PAS domain S-box protein [Desulfarculus sp.]|nr:PAS domain S-box protein [Desulfarculus sp.]
MGKEKSQPPDAADLRQRAEASLAGKDDQGASLATEADSQRLVHELQVHQVELELQNEELRRTSLGLEASRERYADLYDFAPVGYFSVDKRWIIREVNLAGADLLRSKRANLLGKNIGGFISRGTREAFHDFLMRVSAGGTKQVCEVHLDQQGAEPRFVHIEGVAVDPGQGQEAHCRLAAVDITDRKKGEEALRLLAAIVESSDDAIVGMTLQGVITSWNRGAQSIYGYTAEEMVGRPESSLLPLERSGEMNLLLGKVRQGRPVTHFETERMAKDGRRLSISLTLSPTRNSGGEIVGASTIARDITAQKQAEKEREELILQYREALAKVKLLSGLLPICANCKKIRDDKGCWQSIEKYIHERSEADFSHGICPDCVKLLYPGYDE